MSTTIRPENESPLKNHKITLAKKSKPHFLVTETQQWFKHLENRKKPLPLESLISKSKASPLSWNLPDELDRSETARLIDQLHGSPKIDEKAIADWLCGAKDRRLDEAFGLECLAWCHALPGSALSISNDLWWKIFEQLLAAVTECDEIELDDRPLVHQIFTGELPFTLAYLFPEVSSCSGLLTSARQALLLGLDELLDGEGLPHAEDLPRLRPLLACWTRVAKMGQKMKSGGFDDDGIVQIEWLVRQAMRLSRADGSQVFSKGSAGLWCKDLFEAALEISNDPDDWNIAETMLPSGKSLAGGRGDDCDLDESAVNSEWSEMAVLRPDWSRNGQRMTITYADGNFQSELSCGSVIIWSGSLNPEVEVDGKRLQPVSEWEEACWFSDEDVDYLELEITLSSGWRIERHLLMAREDRFLLLADSLLGPQPGEINYTSRLPLCDDIGFEAADETTEGYLISLTDKRRRAAVLPLALSEWKTGASNGSLKMTDEGLVLSQTAKQERLFVPLFIDLEPRRLNKPLTWRQLTVAENLETQPSSVAVGYRVQVASRQWLIYRSLAAQANRTVLGQNLSTQFQVARFDRRGETDLLLEIE